MLRHSGRRIVWTDSTVRNMVRFFGVSCLLPKLRTNSVYCEAAVSPCRQKWRGEDTCGQGLHPELRVRLRGEGRVIEVEMQEWRRFGRNFEPGGVSGARRQQAGDDQERSEGRAKPAALWERRGN